MRPRDFMPGVQRILRLAFTLIIPLVVVHGLPSPAEAILVGLDGWAAGDQRLTRDAGTGLDWLDITATENMSLSTFLQDFPALTNIGFRLATESEVRTLFLDAGAILHGNNPSPNYQADNYAPGILLQTLLGCSLCMEGLRPSLPPPNGFAFDASSQALLQIGTGRGWGFYSLRVDGTAYIGTSEIDQGISPDHHQRGSGIFLVRNTPDVDAPLPGVDPTLSFVPEPGSPVAEPGTLSMLTLGAALVALLRRSRRL